MRNHLERPSQILLLELARFACSCSARIGGRRRSTTAAATAAAASASCAVSACPSVLLHTSDEYGKRAKTSERRKRMQQREERRAGAAAVQRLRAATVRRRDTPCCCCCCSPFHFVRSGFSLVLRRESSQFALLNHSPPQLPGFRLLAFFPAIRQQKNSGRHVHGWTECLRKNV